MRYSLSVDVRGCASSLFFIAVTLTHLEQPNARIDRRTNSETRSYSVSDTSESAPIPVPGVPVGASFERLHRRAANLLCDTLSPNFQAAFAANPLLYRLVETGKGRVVPAVRHQPIHLPYQSPAPKVRQPQPAKRVAFSQLVVTEMGNRVSSRIHKLPKVICHCRNRFNHVSRWRKGNLTKFRVPHLAP